LFQLHHTFISSYLIDVTDSVTCSYNPSGDLVRRSALLDSIFTDIDIAVSITFADTGALSPLKSDSGQHLTGWIRSSRNRKEPITKKIALSADKKLPSTV
jgi:hypothetical protein